MLTEIGLIMMKRFLEGGISTDGVEGQLGVFRCGAVERLPSTWVEGGVHVEGNEDGSGKHFEE